MLTIEQKCTLHVVLEWSETGAMALVWEECGVSNFFITALVDFDDRFLLTWSISFSKRSGSSCF